MGKPEEVKPNPELDALRSAVAGEHMYFASILADGLAHLFRQYAAGNPTVKAPVESLLQTMEQAQRASRILILKPPAN